ncbi:WhiB family transcriptional regulator [Rhodococcoides fascians]|uniref:WhiB family transcriptional regulator n=1 Tax=Rhodococcoides fascians TaxID=1828 RepID=UPI002785FEA1|nr:WhiB family transcriptional regulator [Rhodococcus fascians]MDQ0283789.1 hypothetical protein [Rhodococcus fascians]
MTETPEWVTSATCRTVDPELFFPADPEAAKRAKAICRTCPVITDCAREALQMTPGDLFGVWAGHNFSHHYKTRRTSFEAVAAVANRPISKRRRGDDERDLRIEQVARLTAAGWSALEIARELKVHTRQVCRDRELMRYRKRQAEVAV